ncbi:hypothetical protein HID58_040568, partial [Brassica napus]
PGPDGLTSGFYKAAWPILGEEVLCSISRFFTSFFLPSVIRAARSDRQVSVQALLSSITLTTDPDEHYWYFENKEWEKYNTSAIY